MDKRNLRRALNEWSARKENKRYKKKLGWVLKEIEWHKKEGYTSFELEDHFTPAEKKWLKENSGCEISGYSPVDEPRYYIVFEW